MQQPAATSPDQDMVINTSAPVLSPEEQEQVTLLDKMREASTAIQAVIAGKPKDEIKELNNLIAENFDKIWAALFKQKPEERTKFYNDVFKACIAKQPSLKNGLDDFDYLVEIMLLQKYILVKFLLADPENETLAQLCQFFFVTDSLTYLEAPKSDKFKKELNRTANHILENIYHSTGFYVPVALPDEVQVPTQADIERYLSTDQQRVVREIPWRKTLKAGDKVDAIFIQQLEKHTISHWMPAEIHAPATQSDYFDPNSFDHQDISSSMAQGWKFYIKFEHLPEHQPRLFTRDQVLLAPRGTFTDDFDWRLTLQEGDLVDCLDSYGQWYRSTVFEVRNNVSPFTEQVTIEARIGFRVYDQENGNREDAKGRFIGWGSSYDEWIQVASPRVQRIDTVSHFYKLTGNRNMIYDDINVNDISDSLVNSRTIKVWNKHRSSHFWGNRIPVDAFNEFGQAGGHEKLLQKIATGDHLSTTHLGNIMAILSRTMPIWQRQFAVAYIPRLRQAFEHTITSPNVMKRFSYDSYQRLMNNFEFILRRHYPSSASSIFSKTMDDNYHKIMAHLGLLVASNMINAEKLDTRISGIKEIAQKLESKSGLSDREKLELLRKQNVMEAVFEAKRSHVQLLQRGKDILWFLIDQNQFNEKEIRIVWSSTQKGEEQSKLEFYKLLEHLQIKLVPEQVSMIIGLFANEITPQEFMWQEIECVSKLTEYVPRQSDSIKHACSLLWDIVAQIKPYPKEIIRSAIQKLMSLLKNQTPEVLIEFMNKCIESIGSTQTGATITSVKVLKKIISQIKSKFDDNEAKIRKSELGDEEQIDHLNCKDKFGVYFRDGQKLTALLIEDIRRYTNYSNAQWRQGFLNAQNIENLEILNMPYNHYNNIEGRLKMIPYLLKQSDSTLSDEHIDKLWKILIVDSVIPIEQQIFFSLLKSWISEEKLLTNEQQIRFFVNDISNQAKQGSLKNLNSQGFECIQSIFLSMNEAEDRIVVTSREYEKNAVKVASRTDFEVLVEPSSLRGMEVIWAIFQDCDKTNVHILAPLIDLLSKLYTNLSASLSKDIIDRVQNEFAIQLISQMATSAANTQSSEDEKTIFVKACNIMLRGFLASSEKNGTAGVRSLRSLDRGERIEKILLENSCNFARDAAKYVEVKAFSNLTVWDLKKIASQQFKISARRLEFKRSDDKLLKMNELTHAKTLGEMKVSQYEIITVKKKAKIIGMKLPLVQEDGELTLEAHSVFSEWFTKLSTEDKMWPRDAVRFLKFVQGTPNDYVHEDNPTIKNFFLKHDKDSKGYISRDEFLTFYKERSTVAPEVVWKNLGAGGIGSDLKPIDYELSLEDPLETSDPNDLPRYFMSQDPEIYQQLVKLLTVLPQKAQEELWNIFQLLSPNLEHFRGILNEDMTTYIQSMTPRIYDLLYCLQLVDNLIHYDPSTPQVTTIQYFRDPEAVTMINSTYNYEKKEPRKKYEDALTNLFPAGEDTSFRPQDAIDSSFTLSPSELDPTLEDNKELWVEHFIEKGGFQMLVKMLTDLVGECNRSGKFPSSQFEKDLWNQIIKIIRVLLTASQLAKISEPELVVALSRKVSQSAAHTEESKDENGKKPVNARLIDTMMIFGDDMTEGFDLRDFLDLILQIVGIFLQNDAEMGYDDRFIIEQSINIWISSIIQDQALQSAFFKVEPSPVAEIFINKGLLCRTEEVRVMLKQSLKFISDKIKVDDPRDLPFIQILKLLIRESHVTHQRPLYSKQYFQLLKNLLKKYLDLQKESKLPGVHIFNHRDLLDSYIKSLIEYKSQERKGDADYEDSNLISYMQLVHVLMQSEPRYLTERNQQMLADEIVGSCLFLTESEDSSEHSEIEINKCQSKASRQAASELLQALCHLNPKIVATIIGKHMSKVVDRVLVPRNINLQPELIGKTLGFQGLVNQGNTCYMNALLQQLFTTPQFRYHMLAANDEVDPTYVEFKGDQVDDNMLHQTINMFAFMDKSDRASFNSAYYCHSYKDYGERIRVGQQQDAQEFLVKTLGKLEDGLKGKSHFFAPANIFGGRTSSVRTCQNCQSMSETQEEFQTITLEVKNQSSIYDGLKRFTTAEEIAGFRCEACNQAVDITRRTVINKLPNYLFLHLQRLVFDFDTLQNAKINTRVEFPNLLNIKPYTKGEVFKDKKDLLERARKEGLARAKAEELATKQTGQDDQEMTQQDGDTEQPEDVEMIEELDAVDYEALDNEENFEYKLVGVVLHHGTADFGHYVSIANIERGTKDPSSPDWQNTDKERWLIFNDNRVSPYNFKNLESDCFGWMHGDDTGAGKSFNGSKFNAYILCYEKRVKEDIKIVVPESLLQPMAHGKEQTILIRAPRLVDLCPEIKSDALNAAHLLFDPVRKLHYAKVDFNSVSRYMPPALENKVLHDNASFMVEKYMFSPGFFESSFSMIELMLKQNPEAISEANPNSAGIFQFVEKLVFEILTWGKKTKEVQEMTQTLIRMLKLNRAQTLEFVTRRILKKNEQGEIENTFFKKLLTDQIEIREANSQILLHCISACSAFPELQPMSLQILTNLISLLPVEAIENWQRLTQYFWVINEVIKSASDEQFNKLIEQGIVTKMLDFLYENQSPIVREGKRPAISNTMGNYNNKPDLTHLIAALSNILRRYPNVDMTLSDGDDEMPVQSEEPLRISRFSTYKIGTPLPQTLSVRDKQMLSQKLIIDKLIAGSQDKIELSKLLAHMCYDNREFSRRIAKLTLTGLNGGVRAEMDHYLGVASDLLSINDSVKKERYEWILGFPQQRVVIEPSTQIKYIYQIGAASLTFADEPICDYRSTAFKTINEDRQSLLSLLFTFRKRWAKLTLEGLIAIFKACLDDTSGDLYHYLYTLDPPTVQYARYLDWVIPFIKKHHDASFKNSAFPAYKEELALALQANSLVQRVMAAHPYSGALKKQHDLVNRTVGPATREVFAYDTQIDGGKAPYVILRNEGEVENGQKALSHNRCMVVTNELTVSIIESHPDGKVNRVLDQDYFKKRTAYIHKSQGKGQQAPIATTNTVTPSVASYAGNGSSGTGVPNYQVINGEKQKKKNGSIFEKYGTTTKQMEKAKKKQKHQDGGNYSRYGENGGSDDDEDEQEEYYAEDDDEENKESSPAVSINTTATSTANAVPKFVENGASTGKPKPVEENYDYQVVEAMTALESCVQVVSAINQGNYPETQVVSIRTMHNQSDRSPNVRLPESQIRQVVKGSQIQICLVISKLDPQLPWTPFTIALSAHPKKKFVATADPVVAADVQPTPGSEPVLGMNEKACQACTTINTKWASSCIMCETSF